MTRLKFLYLTTLFFLYSLRGASLSFAQSNFELLFGNASKYQNVIVEKVLNTNTLILRDGEKIKLIGLRPLDMPKREPKEEQTDETMGFVMKRTQDVANPVDPLEVIALKFVKELLINQHVRLEFDSQRIDDHHNTLAYVYLIEEKTMVNTEILRWGYAYLSIQPPNTKHSKILRDAYTEARREKRGLHNQ